MNASEFLKRVDNATLEAMKVLAPDAASMPAADYLLLDRDLGDAVRKLYLEHVTVESALRHGPHYTNHP